jgi:hypothetical protein
MKTSKKTKKIRFFNILVHNGREWVLKSVQETGEAALKARDYFLNQGCKPENVKVIQD